ncbi:MAG: LytTR family transcriptional regulator [Clostridiales Family XIII bacterium]|jgi:DNA-binding LytR/AlgR family response regulator|nr:LytTR family transcriptional regulator [Clostridiales Family XIII bacterium]
MRVEIRLMPDLAEPYAVLHAEKATPDIQAAAEMLEGLPVAGREAPNVLTGRQEDSFFVLEPAEIQIVRTEQGEVMLYDGTGQRFLSGKKLYELERMLGNAFCRISKGAIVNILKIARVEAGFGGALDIVMHNGVHEYISRRYVTAFKERIGL